MTVSKEFSSKASAKRALKRIFGVGPYSEGRMSASTKFCNGHIEGSTLILRSTYWIESSLQDFLSGKEKL